MDQYACARICIEVDLEADLLEAIKLTVGAWSHFQKLNYEQLPFKCRVCHEYGHFHRNHSKNQEAQLEKEKYEGWQAAKKYKTNPKSKQGPRREAKNPDTIKTAQTSPPKKSFEQDPFKANDNNFSLLQVPEENEAHEASIDGSEPLVVG